MYIQYTPLLSPALMVHAFVARVLDCASNFITSACTSSVSSIQMALSFSCARLDKVGAVCKRGTLRAERWGLVIADSLSLSVWDECC